MRLRMRRPAATPIQARPRSASAAAEAEHVAIDVDRVLRAAERAQRLGLLHRQVEPVPRAPRQLQAARGEAQRFVEAVVPCFGLRRARIGGRGAFVLAAVQMLGAQRRIALLEPRRRQPVQLAPRLAQQRGIDAVAHQRMDEQELVEVGPHQ